jgi:hypothetical protein
VALAVPEEQRKAGVRDTVLIAHDAYEKVESAGSLRKSAGRA